MTEWKTHTPEYYGHAPDDWDGGYTEFFASDGKWIPAEPSWSAEFEYRYKAKKIDVNALTAQCLALPQADREALIEALQKPVRDWADDVWKDACASANEARAISQDKAAAAVIRSMCRPKEDGRSEEFEHVAYYDDCEFHWMSGIVARDCELFARRKESLK